MTEYKAPDVTLVGEAHIERYLATDGQEGYLWNGATCLLLTTTGRKSGTPRTSALIFGSVPLADGSVDVDRGDCILIASMGGAPTHPQWYLNLAANPTVQVQVRADKFEATAVTVEGDERARLWKITTEQWPNYDVYAERTTRHIPVVRLQRS